MINLLLPETFNLRYDASLEYHGLIYRDALLTDEEWLVIAGKNKETLLSDIDFIRFRLYKVSLSQRLSAIGLTDSKKKKIISRTLEVLEHYFEIGASTNLRRLAVYALKEKYQDVILCLFLIDLDTKSTGSKELLTEIAESLLIDQFAVGYLENT